MILRRCLFLALGLSPFLAASPATTRAQEPTLRPTILTSESRTKDAAALTRTGARRTAVVSAIERVKNAVVNIHSERNVAYPNNELSPLPPTQNRVNGMGTGIIIDPRGYIVTNQHVVDDVTSLRIRLADGTTQNAIVVARNPEMDLAILKIDPVQPLQTIPIGTATDLMVGETVIAVGNAYGYEHTASVGIVSALKRDVSLNKDMSYKSLIQTDASINPGNSGGPLINIHGELIGVNVAIRAGAQGIGFAIPVDHMVKSVSEMLKVRRRSHTFDGLTCRDIVETANEGFIRRVVVDRVEPGSPAEAAGLRVGDDLVQLGELKVATGIDIERCFLDRKSGETICVIIRRKDEEKKIDLALGSADRAVRPVAQVADIVWQKLGVQLASVPADSVTRINGQLHGGLEVTNINANSAAARAGIRKGDILVGLHQWETVSLDNITYVLNHPDLASFNPMSFFIVRDRQVRRGQLPAIP
jgi:serine protease Do